ncbi:MAG: hypothetical protein EA392_12545 [Cryomorphaceae bacterium]|nr:MAG: hypothetical protein EA392_12545 [Cryomorphaceae bacterium]
MSNNLAAYSPGNVRATITDRKVASFQQPQGGNWNITGFTADIASAQDYYPFGSSMPGRSFNSPDYRHGFNGQEKVDEIKGAGNHYTAEYWEYDPRIGRRWNTDPVVASWESPYAAFRNNPIFLDDPFGDCADCEKEAEEKNEATKEGTVPDGDSFSDVNGAKFDFDKDMNAWIPANPGGREGSTEENASIKTGKRWSFNDDAFWEIEPTYSDDDRLEELQARGFDAGSKLNSVIKLLKKRSLSPDFTSLVDRKLEFAIKGRLKTLGPGNSMVIQITQSGTISREVKGVRYIKYLGPDESGKEQWINHDIIWGEE